MHKTIYFVFLLIITTNTQCLDQKIFSISIPKSGTHLLRKCLTILTDKTLEIAHPSPSDFTVIDEKRLKLLNNQHFLGIHPIATPHHYQLLSKYQVKGIFIYRDPRDLVVSLAYYMKKLNVWPASRLPIPELITRLITDCSIVYGPQAWHNPLWKNIRTIKDFYTLYLGWAKQSYVYTTTFEKLVGKHGGGSDSEQEKELYAIADHIGITLNKNLIQKIRDDMFGNSPTFRSGQIGEWKTHFTTEQKKLFKNIAGQLLIDLGYEKNMNW